MKYGSTFFLRGAGLLFGAAAAALYLFALPWFTGITARMIPSFSFLRQIAATGWYMTAIPVYFALYQTFVLLRCIDKTIAFSELAVKALGNIKRAAVATSGLLMVGLPTAYYLAQADDAPGIMLLGMIIAFAPLVIAVFAAVLQMLLHQAIEIKTENDSTI